MTEKTQRVDKLEQALFELQADRASGTLVPQGVRVLSLRENPVQTWTDLRQAAMNRMRAENDALLKRLAVLCDQRSSNHNVAGEDLVPRESFLALQKDKEEIKDDLLQKEKRLLRLRQAC